MSQMYEIECKKCEKRYKIDVSKYIKKTIKFSCKNCGNQISQYIPDPAEELKNQIEKPDKNALVDVLMPSKDKKKKDKKPGLLSKLQKKDKSENPEESSDAQDAQSSPAQQEQSSTASQRLGTGEFDTITGEISPPAQTPAADPYGATVVQQAPDPSAIVEPPHPGTGEFDIPQDGSKSDDSLPETPMQDQAFSEPQHGTEQTIPEPAQSAPAEPVRQPPPTETIIRPSLTSKPQEIDLGEDEMPVQMVTRSSAMIHIPKPGMPFVSSFHTPAAYKAGSTKRKDYSFVVSELAKIREDMGMRSEMFAGLAAPGQQQAGGDSVIPGPAPAGAGEFIPSTRVQRKVKPEELVPPDQLTGETQPASAPEPVQQPDLSAPVTPGEQPQPAATAHSEQQVPQSPQTPQTPAQPQVQPQPAAPDPQTPPTAEEIVNPPHQAATPVQAPPTAEEIVNPPQTPAPAVSEESESINLDMAPKSSGPAIPIIPLEKKPKGPQISIGGTPPAVSPPAAPQPSAAPEPEAQPPIPPPAAPEHQTQQPIQPPPRPGGRPIQNIPEPAPADPSQQADFVPQPTPAPESAPADGALPPPAKDEEEEENFGPSNFSL